MNNEIVNAMEELENWLADPSELGRKPAKIEYTASFEDEDGIKCMIFKFKKSFFGKWLLGIVSESGTFSEMKEYNSATETENAKALLHILKEYWKKMAEKEQGFIEIPIENLIEWDEPNGEGCIVSDKITKEGYKVGYMLREEPTEGNPDSGWRFMAGNEDDEYMDNPDNHHVFALNTICNYDSDIIEKLFKSFLLERRGKDIYLTSKAKQLLELVPEELKQPELTADWEMRLSQIAKGKLSRKDFMKDIDKYTDQVVSEIKAGAGTFRHDNLTNSKCPRCGKRMLAVKGKNSEMLVCQDRECGYRETVSRTTNARCPVCHKKMQLKGRGDGQIFVCVCGHKEKLTSFQERRKKEGAGVSKKDVQKYLRQQKDEPMNNPFADALAKIKL